MTYYTCIVSRAVTLEQKMADLPEERYSPSPAFTFVCLDLAAPIKVKAMTNKRAEMKCWPIIFVCQVTGAVHIELMHDYGCEAFLLQFEHFRHLRGNPAVIVSDRGSQLTANANYVTWPTKEDPSKWNWGQVEEVSARKEDRVEICTCWMSVEEWAL